MTMLEQARRALAHDNPAVRLKAALAVGTHPDSQLIGTLIGRCAVEPDFQVRETLTWALTRQPADLTVAPLVEQLGSDVAQARSQALHTLSKIGDRRAYPAITRELLTDADDEVARTAWRAAVALAPEETPEGTPERAPEGTPEGERARLARLLVTQLGRGGRDTQLSLSRALVGLGEMILPILHEAMTDQDPGVRHHAAATERLFRDPDAGFELAVEEAKRVVAMGVD